MSCAQHRCRALSTSLMNLLIFFYCFLANLGIAINADMDSYEAYHFISDSMQPHTQGKMSTSALHMEIRGSPRRQESCDQVRVSWALP